MIKQDTFFLPYFPPNTSHPNQENMFGDPDSNPTSYPISDWLDDSVSSYIPSFLDDPFGPNPIIDDDRWWVPPQDLDQEIFSNSTVTTSANTTISTDTPSDYLVFSDHSKQLMTDVSKKRKAPPTVQPKKPINRRGHGKSTKDGCNKDVRSGRWAEQLLNPCAAAISAGNVPRVRHLVIVLRELASPTGDANYRLAAHGLRALTHHLSSTKHRVVEPKMVPTPLNFSTAEPQFFKQTLINFNEINPWFTIPNHIANGSILQVLSDHDRGLGGINLHILDIGVSHGFQWPTLLEALSRRPGGPPPLVRLTVVTPTPTPENTQIPFANSPPGYNSISNILRSATQYKINLHINTLDNCPLQNLNSHIIKSSPEEILIVCAQFRLNNLNHNNTPDNRTEFLKIMRNLEPKGVILNDNNMECSCDSCSTFETGFARKVDALWSFLDSTSVAFKTGDTEERKMMEGEASKALMNMCIMNEPKEKWVERMIGVGFAGDDFREDVMDGARALLKKYDSNWNLRVDDKDKCLSLWWKGQPVSFCSLWKIDAETININK